MESKNEYRLCLFIDALDEFEGDRGQTYLDLVDKLKAWTMIAPGALKLCLSSREHLVFQTHLNSRQRLRLHDLTQFDMLCYTGERLDIIGQWDDRERMVRRIVAKAEGVFLWVALVTKNVRQGIEDGLNLASVEAELDALPGELDDLFSYLLRSISTTQQQRAHQIFALVLAFQPYSTRLSLHACLNLDDFKKGPQFAVKLELQETESTSETLQLRE
jgi:hypothetical protein